MDVALAQRTIDQLARALRQLLTLVTIGLVLTGLIVGSAVVLASTGTSESAGGVVDTAGIIFRLAAIAGGVIVISLAARLVRTNRTSR